MLSDISNKSQVGQGVWNVYPFFIFLDGVASKRPDKGSAAWLGTEIGLR
jgi:hypothetical protein